MGFHNKHIPIKITKNNLPQIKEWTILCEALNIPQFDAGSLLKKRFHNRLGNDQLWEGKMDERNYNTDFIGVYSSDKVVIHMDEINSETMHIGDDRKILPKPNSLFPYLVYNSTGGLELDGSWLSDHGLVYSNLQISVPTISHGGYKLSLNRTINRKRRSKHRRRRKNIKSKLRRKSYKRKSTRKN